jgi:hypothetical protein
MSDFVPLGFIRIADYTGDSMTLRDRLFARELEPFIWHGQYLEPITNENFWLGDAGKHAIDTGVVLLNGLRWTVLLKIDLPPAKKTASGKRGKPPEETERVMREILACGGLDAVRDAKQEAMASRFNTTRTTYREALKRLEKSAK